MSKSAWFKCWRLAIHFSRCDAIVGVRDGVWVRVFGLLWWQRSS